MSRWTVDLSPRAQREFRQLEQVPKDAAFEIIQDLAEEGPILVPGLELRANPHTWRVRFHHERYRMIYQVSRVRRHILVTRIRLRPTAYEGIKH